MQYCKLLDSMLFSRETTRPPIIYTYTVRVSYNHKFWVVIYAKYYIFFLIPKIGNLSNMFCLRWNLLSIILIRIFIGLKLDEV